MIETSNYIKGFYDDNSDITIGYTEIIKLFYNQKKQLDSTKLLSILKEGYKILSKQKNVSYIDSTNNVIVFGDTMGEFYKTCDTLLNIKGNSFDKEKGFVLDTSKFFVFNGNYLINGEHSIENYTFLLILKILYPKNIYLNRSEFECLNLRNKNGLFDKIMIKYGITKKMEFKNISFNSNNCKIINILLAFHLTFSVLPLATIIGKEALVINFGLPRENYSIDQIMLLDRKVVENNTEDKTTFDLMFDCLVDSETFNAYNVTRPGIFWYKNTTENFFNNKDKILIIKSDNHVSRECDLNCEENANTFISPLNICFENLKAAYIIFKTQKEKENDIKVRDNLFYEVIQFSERSRDNP
ncbi:hypothetical protein GVAV_002214 [Gurleya vavrai]